MEGNVTSTSYNSNPIAVMRAKAQNPGVSGPLTTPADRRAGLPLSFAQQRLWFLAQMEGGNQAYHVSNGLLLRGELDHAALRRALDRIVARHEALRTTFTAIDGQAVQRIAPADDAHFPLLEHDIRLHRTPTGELQRLFELEANLPLDLESGPLIRGRLVQIAIDEHALLISMHHIVSDGWSVGVFIRELNILYAAFRQGLTDPLPDLPMQYADYAAWQRKWVEGEVFQRQAEYWKSTLAGAPSLLELPTDYARPARQSFAGGFEEMVFDPSLSSGLKALSKRNGTTLFMTLLAGWATILARICGQPEVVIGIATANRNRSEIEGLIGFFVNALALRISLDGSPTVSELLARVKSQTVAAQQHQDIPFEQVVEHTRPLRSPAHSPIFQVMFDWQNTPASTLTFPGLVVSPLPSPQHRVAKFDLRLSLQETNGTIAGGIEYATSLFEPTTMERFVSNLQVLLQAMIEDDSQLVGRLPLLSAAERHRLLYDFNQTTTDWSRDETAQELLAE